MAGQTSWKWIALALLLGLFLVATRMVQRLSRSVNEDRPLLRAFVRLALPVFLVIATPVVAVLALVQINIFGTLASASKVLSAVVAFAAGAWLVWRGSDVVSQTLISAPGMVPGSINASAIRLAARLLRVFGVVVLLALVADRAGARVYGIVAGLGVGGLAIALAAQPTIENLLGSLSLFADRPVRVGDRCQYGDMEGWVEAIGLRSTRIRGLDRKLATIPNRDFANMAIVNFTQRDRRLLNTIIGVRYETTAEQLRFLLARIRDLLIAHPLINRDLLHVRLVGFGPRSLDIEIFAYVRTRDRLEFFAIREDILLRIMDLVDEAGTSIAFPSQAVYFARDSGLDPARAQAAESEVRKWREDGRLPFPEFSREQMARIRATLQYPPEGSAEAAEEAAQKAAKSDDHGLLKNAPEGPGTTHGT